MPTYEYVCKQCGDRFEIFQPFSAKLLKKHEVCGGPLQKVFHPAGVVFKGSGFYSTDSRSKSSSVSPAKDKGQGEGQGEGQERRQDRQSRRRSRIVLGSSSGSSDKSDE